MRNWGGRWIGYPGLLPDKNIDTGDAPSAPLPTLTTDRSVLGEHAKRLLDDPLLTLAFEKLREDLAVAWRNTKADDTQGRERAYFMRWALEGVRGKLQALLNDAKVIEAEQKRKEAEASR